MPSRRTPLTATSGWRIANGELIQTQIPSPTINHGCGLSIILTNLPMMRPHCASISWKVTSFQSPQRNATSAHTCVSAASVSASLNLLTNAAALRCRSVNEGSAVEGYLPEEILDLFITEAEQPQDA